MKLIKKMISVFLVLSVFFQFPWHVNAEDEVKEYHFVIVYDVSKSMAGVDENKNIPDRISVFLNQIPAKDYYPAKVMVLPFAETVNIINSQDDTSWWEYPEYQQENFKTIQEEIMALEYDQPFTNISQVLQVCSSKLKEARENVKNCEQVVLFMTDGLPDCNAKNDEKIAELCEIYNKEAIERIADDFPTDVAFLGIIPDEKNLNGDLEYTDGNITRYYGTEVDEEYYEKMNEVSHCMDNFCQRLLERQEEQDCFVKLNKINWDEFSSEKAEKIFEDFYKEIFGAHVTKKQNQELENGIDFMVDELVSEVNVSITFNDPESETLDDLVEYCKENLQFTKGNGEVIEPYVANTKTTVTAKLVDPGSGICSMYCEGMSEEVNISFNSYGSMEITIFDSKLNGVVGEEVVVTGNVLNRYKNAIFKNQFISVSYICQLIDEASGDVLNDEYYETQYSEDEWCFSFIPEEPGEYIVRLKAEYNDTHHENPWGISHIDTTEEITIMIGEVATDETESTIVNTNTVMATMTTPLTEAVATIVEDTDAGNDPIDLIKMIYDDYGLVISVGLIGIPIIALIMCAIIKITISKTFVVKCGDRVYKVSVKKIETWQSTKVKGLRIRYNKNEESWSYWYSASGDFINAKERTISNQENKIYLP